jgi:hypothetical protein
MDSDGKMRPLDWLLDLLDGGAVHTWHFLKRKPEEEDQLDHLHRLAKADVPVEIIAAETRLPIESVEYVMETNGYDRHRLIQEEELHRRNEAESG